MSELNPATVASRVALIPHNPDRRACMRRLIDVLGSAQADGQLGAIRKTCKNAEFVFLEPPVIVQKADMPWNQRLDDFASSATTEEAEQTPETTPRAWWLSPGDRSVYKRECGRGAMWASLFDVTACS